MRFLLTQVQLVLFWTFDWPEIGIIELVKGLFPI